ncbi:integrative conjugative element protein, RAQPRD family [Pseudomonas aeruginosa]
MSLPRRLMRLFTLALACLSPLAFAGEAELRMQLAMLERQLEGIERQAESGAAQAATTFSPGSNRYHFDFIRLRDDVRRMRGGVQDYLTPARAQPRDPLELRGDYRQDALAKEAP